MEVSDERLQAGYSWPLERQSSAGRGARMCQESAKPPLSGDTSLHYQGTDSHQANPALHKWRETESKRVCLASWKYLALFTLQQNAGTCKQQISLSQSEELTAGRRLGVRLVNKQTNKKSIRCLVKVPFRKNKYTFCTNTFHIMLKISF